MSDNFELKFSSEKAGFDKIELGIYKKEIMKEGNYAHPQYPEKRFNVTVDRIKGWIDNFKSKVMDIVQVPMTDEAGHSAVEKPENNRGEVLDVWQENDHTGLSSLWAKIKVDDATSKLIDGGKLKGVSASIRNFIDNKTGKTIGEILHHILLTNDPYITGTKPFMPIINNEGEICESAVNLSRIRNKSELSAVSYKDYDIIEGNDWDGGEAESQIKTFASSDDSGDKETIDFDKYKEGFAWYNAEDKENFGSYKLPHHIVVDGKLRTHRGGVIASGNALAGARGGVDLPAEDRSAVENHINKHREQLDLEPLDFEKENPDDKDKPENKDIEKEENDMEKLEKLKKEKAELEKKVGSLKSKTDKMSELEKQNKVLAEKQAEYEKAKDKQEVEAWLKEGRITEAMKDTALSILNDTRDSKIELENDKGEKEEVALREQFIAFMAEVPESIDYSVQGNKANGKPDSEDANLESDGKKAGDKVRGKKEDK
jgi:hypothetical protein